ncbi:MAG: hypothetical protein OWV35_04270, partial [Firmicutes bacterium]|nr:hypothetical protein [Bacillota bacterium]
YPILARALIALPWIRRIVDLGCAFGLQAAEFRPRWRYWGVDQRPPLGEPDGQRRVIPFFGAEDPGIAYRIGHVPEAVPAPEPGDVAVALLSVGYEAHPPDPNVVAAALTRYRLVVVDLAPPYAQALAGRFRHHTCWARPSDGSRLWAGSHRARDLSRLLQGLPEGSLAHAPGGGSEPRVWAGLHTKRLPACRSSARKPFGV